MQCKQQVSQRAYHENSMIENLTEFTLSCQFDSCKLWTAPASLTFARSHQLGCIYGSFQIDDPASTQCVHCHYIFSRTHVF